VADQHGDRAAVLRAEDPLDLRGANRIGRTSIANGAMTSAIRAAQASAASRSGALITVNPPRCSLPSVNGPSVSSGVPSRSRTTVAALAGCSPAAKTQAPAARISSFSAASPAMIGSRTSGGGGSPSGW
jgi:hypothetical protein